MHIINYTCKCINLQMISTENSQMKKKKQIKKREKEAECSWTEHWTEYQNTEHNRNKQIMDIACYVQWLKQNITKKFSA
jgi:hypothetical protein